MGEVEPQVTVKNTIIARLGSVFVYLLFRIYPGPRHLHLFPALNLCILKRFGGIFYSRIVNARVVLKYFKCNV